MGTSLEFVRIVTVIGSIVTSHRCKTRWSGEFRVVTVEDTSRCRIECGDDYLQYYSGVKIVLWVRLCACAYRPHSTLVVCPCVSLVCQRVASCTAKIEMPYRTDVIATAGVHGLSGAACRADLEKIFLSLEVEVPAGRQYAEIEHLGKVQHRSPLLCPFLVHAQRPHRT